MSIGQLVHPADVRPLRRGAHLILGGDALTAQQLAWAIEQTEAQGNPPSVTMFERFTIRAR